MIITNTIGNFFTIYVGLISYNLEHALQIYMTLAVFPNLPEFIWNYILFLNLPNGLPYLCHDAWMID